MNTNIITIDRAVGDLNHGGAPLNCIKLLSNEYLTRISLTENLRPIMASLSKNYLLYHRDYL